MVKQNSKHRSPLELPEGFLLPVPAPGSGCLLHAGHEVRILLHCCCAPCSAAILEWMVGAGLRPGIFFSNANIFPAGEYELRKSVLAGYAGSYGFEVVEDEYDHAAWLAYVRRLEHHPAASDAAFPPPSRDARSVVPEPFRIDDMPERGPRCLECFKFRLLRAARYAASHGYEVLTTTLASSRWKNLSQVDAAGRYACSLVNGESVRNRSGAAIAAPASRPEAFQTGREVIWWGQNWRKGGLQERRNCLIRERGLYSQDWCGCEFSLRRGRE